MRDIQAALERVLEEETGDAPIGLSFVRIRTQTIIAVRAYFPDGGFDQPRDFVVEVRQTQKVTVEEVQFETWPAYPPHPNWQGVE